MSVVSFALAVVFIIRLFSTSAFRVPSLFIGLWENRQSCISNIVTRFQINFAAHARHAKTFTVSVADSVYGTTRFYVLVFVNLLWTFIAQLQINSKAFISPPHTFSSQRSVGTSTTSELTFETIIKLYFWKKSLKKLKTNTTPLCGLIHAASKRVQAINYVLDIASTISKSL